jgi:hypothetical protein
MEIRSMITTSRQENHSKPDVSQQTGQYVEFEIFYLNGENIERVTSVAKTLRGAVSHKRINKSKIVDASWRDRSEWYPVALDTLDWLMGV